MADLTPCRDCGRNTPQKGNYYILKPELWLAIGMGPKGYLCDPCLAMRFRHHFNREPVLADYWYRVKDDLIEWNPALEGTGLPSLDKWYAANG